MLLFKARPRKDPSLSSALTASQRRMMRTLREAREATQRQLQAQQAEIMRLLLHAPVTQILRAVPTDAWLDIQGEIGVELQAELIDSGRRVRLPPIQKATVTYRFDDARPEAAAWAAKEAGTLIQDITNDQLSFVRDVVSHASMGEMTPVQAAQVFREMQDGMGLTTQQSGWVENFRQQRITEGMERGLSYEQAEQGSAKATKRYADRIYRYRTETIARTEIMRASNEGRNQAWQQGIEGGWIAPDSLKKWSVEIDGRECSICRPLGDLDPIPINASFPSGDPPVHPNCRCTVVLTDEVPSDLLSMTDDELEAEISRLLGERTQGPGAGVIYDEMPFRLAPTEEAISAQPTFDKRAKTFEALGVDPGIAEDMLREGIRTAANDDIIVFVKAEALAGIAQDGRFRTIDELQSRSPGYQGARDRVEGAFGVPPDAPASDKPIYGAISNHKRASSYGPFGFVVKPRVKGRATMAGGDTFEGQVPVPVTSVLSGDASLDDMSRAIKKRSTDTLALDIAAGRAMPEDVIYGDYWETQIYGGLRLDDIDEIRVDRRHGLTDDERTILQQFEARGIRIAYDATY